MGSAPSLEVYGLIDPITGRLRYVGKCMDGAARRLKRHVTEARGRRSEARSHRNRWIRSILDEGKTPEVVVIERVREAAELSSAERFWIAYYRKQGFNLVNATDGGDGAPGYRAPPEVRAKISEISRTNPKRIAARNAMHAANVGKKWNDEQRQRLGEALRKSPAAVEHLRRMSEGNRGRVVSEAERAKRSAAAKASAAVRANVQRLTGRPKSPEHRAKLAEANRRVGQARREANLAKRGDHV